MLLIIFACSIFLFLTVTIGNWLSDLMAGIFTPARFSLFQSFLSGFAFISTYLNIWSLFLPVNFYSLLPVSILSVYVCKHSISGAEKIKKFVVGFFKNPFAIVTIPVLLVIIVYALLPPQHGDSPGYHFLTIRWNEEYKTIHGLANLHGRLGFNSSFFVSSAAFAFTKIAGQPLYVLNIVFAVCYYLWLINKISHYKNSLWSIVFVFIAVAMFRQLIDSISSPTPDVLSSIIISYVFITIAEAIFIKEGVYKNQSIIIVLLICFAFTVKLNTFPLSFTGAFLFTKSKLYKSKKALLSIIAAGFVILIPWITRNYILTGYLVFPVAATGFFHPDWQVPFQIFHHEKLLINNGPKLISQNWEALDKLSFTQWFPLWIKAHQSNGLTFSLVILLTGVMCTVISLVVIGRKQHPSLFWLAIINIVSIFFWLYNSPDYRFGYPYLINAILLLTLYVTKDKSLKPVLKPITATLVILLCAYYLNHAINILWPHNVSSFAVRPLQVLQYKVGDNISGFPFVMLNKNVKLYMEDSSHWCNRAGLPCLIPYDDGFPTTLIKLRGNNIEDGFRITKNR